MPSSIHMKQSSTVVLLHSSASSARQWQGLVESLQPRFQVRAIDFPGHGGRPAWPGDSTLSLADEAALVAPLLAETGGAHIVGHSYGAAVALKLATMHPSLVRSVVVYEPVLFRWLLDDHTEQPAAQEIEAVVDSISHRLARGQELSAAQRFINYWSGSGAWESLHGGKRHFIATRMRAVLQHFDALFREPLARAQLAALRIPMLFMTGAQTVLAARRLAELFRYALPQHQHELLPGMGHMGPVTHALEVNRRIVKYLHAHEPIALAENPREAAALAMP